MEEAVISKSTISLTQADMCAAVAYWLNATTMKESVKVTSVEASEEYSGVEHFTVDVERAEQTGVEK